MDPQGNTGEITGRAKGYKNLRPPWPKGYAPNPTGRPKGCVRNWGAVMKEFFELLQDDPAKLEKLTGLKIPANIKKNDGQLILVCNEFIRALKGDSRAVGEIMNRMDGMAEQNINLKGNSIVQFIQEGHKAAQQAKTEAEERKRK
jgi:hypothetical protein